MYEIPNWVEGSRVPLGTCLLASLPKTGCSPVGGWLGPRTMRLVSETHLICHPICRYHDFHTSQLR